MNALLSMAAGLTGLAVLLALAGGLVLNEYQTPAEAVDWVVSMIGS